MRPGLIAPWSRLILCVFPPGEMLALRLTVLLPCFLGETGFGPLVLERENWG